MDRYGSLLFFAALACIGAGRACAEDVRYYEEDGVTFRETVRTVQRPMIQTEWQKREQTVYRRQLRTDYRDSLRTYCTPVTTHEWVTRMHGRWNPFVTPYFTHHLAPVTRWERRTEVVKVPVLETEWVPETRTVSVPVTTHRMVEEQHISRMAVNMTGVSRSTRRVVRRPDTTETAFGGTALAGDPPRQGLHWRRPGTETLRR